MLMKIKFSLLCFVFIFFISCSEDMKEKGSTYPYIDTIQKYPNGKSKLVYVIYEGNSENRQNLFFVAFYENGDTMKQGMFRKGKEDGEWKYYFRENRLSSKGNFSKGIRTGKGIRYYQSGEVEQEFTYENNEIVNVVFYYRNGSLKREPLDLNFLVKSEAKLWTESQKEKIKERAFQDTRFYFEDVMPYYDCLIDSVALHVDFNSIDTLSDYDRGLLYAVFLKKGDCQQLLPKPIN